ncbi:MAG: galactosyltransferase-related protein [Pacificimonas sp.]
MTTTSERINGLTVCTLVRGRRDHLVNLMRGLRWQERMPDELVITWMQETQHDDLPDPGCPVRHVFVSGEELPLAAARNAAAGAARYEKLVFLDVDCIPSPALIARYDRALDQHHGLFLSEILYLPQGAGGDDLEIARLDELGKVHPSKPPIPETGLREEPDHDEFWGLCFGIHASTWDELGGMDEGYIGYGAEETDLAARLRKAGVPVFWTAGARAWHQHHEVYTPPLQHFDAIIRNARRYHEKWNRFPMTYWLGQFADLGLISRAAGKINVIRKPTDAEIAGALQPPDILFS